MTAPRFLLATRKGLFVVERTAPRAWEVARSWFLGDNLSMVMADPRDGAWYACFEHGHFGVKLKRSVDQGNSWEDLASPAYPEEKDGAKLLKIWSLEPGGKDEPGVLWAGTIP